VLQKVPSFPLSFPTPCFIPSGCALWQQMTGTTCGTLAVHWLPLSWQLCSGMSRKCGRRSLCHILWPRCVIVPFVACFSLLYAVLHLTVVNLHDEGHDHAAPAYTPLPQALALNLSQLTTLRVHATPALADGWPLLGHLSSLVNLRIKWDHNLGPGQLPPSIWRALQGLQTLRGVTFKRSIKRTGASHVALDVNRVSGLTQLQSLSLSLPYGRFTLDCAGLSRLTGLTSLSMDTPAALIPPAPVTVSDVPTSQRQRRLWQIQQQRQRQQALEQWRQHQQQLQHSLSCMQHLRALDLGNNPVPAGIAHTLEGLSQLTSLLMKNIQADQQWYAAALCRPVLLPCLQLLLVKGEGALQFLAGTYAPVLRELQHLGIPLGTPIDQARVLGFSTGALRLCSNVEFLGPVLREEREVPPGQLRALLAALCAAQQCFPSYGPSSLQISYLCCTQADLAIVPPTATVVRLA
jgi:hypothetical protein